MPCIDRDLQRAAAQKATRPALYSRPVSCHLSCDWIESFAFSFSVRVFLYIVRHGEEWGQRVGQIQQRRGGYDTDEAEVVWNRGCDDESDGPPDRDHDGVENFSATSDERRCVEQVHEDVVVENLDTDVAVQSGSNKGGDEGDHVADCLPAVD